MNIKTSILTEKSYSAAGAGSSQQVRSNTQTPCSRKSFKLVKPVKSVLGKLLICSSLASANQNFTSTSNCPDFQLHCKDRNIEFTTSYDKNSVFCQGEFFNSVLEEDFIPHIYPEICENLDYDTNKTVALGPENFNSDLCDSGSCLAFMDHIKNDVFVTATIGIPSPQPSVFPTTTQPTTTQPTTALPSFQPTTALPSFQPTTALPTTPLPTYAPIPQPTPFPTFSPSTYVPSSWPTTYGPTLAPTQSFSPTQSPSSAPTSARPSHSPTSPPSKKALTKEKHTPSMAGVVTGSSIGTGIVGLMFGIFIMKQSYKMKENNHSMPRNVNEARIDLEAASTTSTISTTSTTSNSRPDFSDHDADSTG